MHGFSGEAAKTREIKNTMGMQEGTVENRIALCKLFEKGIGKGFFLIEDMEKDKFRGRRLISFHILGLL